MKLLNRLPEFISFVTENVRTNFLEPLLQQGESFARQSEQPPNQLLTGETGETVCVQSLEVEVVEKENEERISLVEQPEGVCGWGRERKRERETYE